nr:hypothetical protein [Planctomycetota bacterium]
MSPAPRAVIVSIGEELLEGRITDTNAPTFAAELLRLGFLVRGMHTVGDAPGELRALLERLRGGSDLVLTTGGRGPPADHRVPAAGPAPVGGPPAAGAGAPRPLGRPRPPPARHRPPPGLPPPAPGPPSPPPR